MIDRSKFKATSVAKNVETDKAVDQQMGRKNNNYTGVHKIEEGKNLFRIYPPHPEELKGGDTFAEPCVKVFLPIWVEEKDAQGNAVMEKGKAKMKEINKPIFNSRYHGGTEKDLVEEYIALAKKIADEIKDKTERQSFLDKVYGKFSKIADQRLAGCNYKTTYVMYADKITGAPGAYTLKFDRLEVGKTVKEDLNKIAANEAGDEPMGVDPFTDPDDGRAIMIVFDKGATKPSDFYKTSIDSHVDKTTKQARFFPLTDEQFAHFETVPSLVSLYKDVFKKSDFEWQLKGLENFDAKYDLNIFERPEWEEIVEEIASYYEDEEPTAEEVKEVVEAVEEVVEEEEKDSFDLMSRAELRTFNSSNKLGVKIITTMTDDDIRIALRAAEKKGKIPHIPLPGEEGYVAPQVASPVAASSDRLSKFRKGK